MTVGSRQTGYADNLRFRSAVTLSYRRTGIGIDMVSADLVNPFCNISFHNIRHRSGTYRIDMRNPRMRLSASPDLIQITQNLAAFENGLTCLLILNRLVKDQPFRIRQPYRIFFIFRHQKYRHSLI